MESLEDRRAIIAEQDRAYSESLEFDRQKATATTSVTDTSDYSPDEVRCHLQENTQCYRCVLFQLRRKIRKSWAEKFDGVSDGNSLTADVCTPKKADVATPIADISTYNATSDIFTKVTSNIQLIHFLMNFLCSILVPLIC